VCVCVCERERERERERVRACVLDAGVDQKPLFADEMFLYAERNTWIE
jgi:hypothetical protein